MTFILLLFRIGGLDLFLFLTSQNHSASENVIQQLKKEEPYVEKVHRTGARL